jgi:large subunit ribosomal protein L13
VNTLSYKTVSANRATVNKEWILIDATDMVLGRLSSKIAYMLRGKNKANFTPHVDCGDNVIIINADKVRLTGNKENAKTYVSHTLYPGGQKHEPYLRMKSRFPERIIEKAVRGMLPKNRLGRQLFNNMHVFAGNEHPHEAQKPRIMELN